MTKKRLGIPIGAFSVAGFDRLANQRLLPPTFPRYTEIRSRPEAAEYFRRLVDRLLAATAVAQVGNFHMALVCRVTST